MENAMLFWILTILITIGAIWWIVNTIHVEFTETILGTIVVAIVQLIASFVIWTFVTAGIVLGVAYFTTPYTPHTSTSETLIALQTKDTIEGKFSGGIFASRGYIEGKPVISYVTKGENGGMRTGYAPADNTVIYESNDDKPKLETQVEARENGWLAPGIIMTRETYKITIPEGSVIETFEIAP